MLLVFHIVLVAAGILFSFGFALLQLIQYGREGSTEKLLLGIFFVLAGSGLSVYLRRVFRYGLRGKPR
jgi:hypothetical protein